IVSPCSRSRSFTNAGGSLPSRQVVIKRRHSRNPANRNNRIKQNCTNKSAQSPIAIRPFTDELKTSAGGIIAAKTIDSKNAVGKPWGSNEWATTSVIRRQEKSDASNQPFYTRGSHKVRGLTNLRRTVTSERSLGAGKPI